MHDNIVYIACTQYLVSMITPVFSSYVHMYWIVLSLSGSESAFETETLDIICTWQHLQFCISRLSASAHSTSSRDAPLVQWMKSNVAAAAEARFKPFQPTLTPNTLSPPPALHLLSPHPPLLELISFPPTPPISVRSLSTPVNQIFC